MQVFGNTSVYIRSVRSGEVLRRTTKTTYHHLILPEHETRKKRTTIFYERKFRLDLILSGRLYVVGLKERIFTHSTCAPFYLTPSPFRGFAFDLLSK